MDGPKISLRDLLQILPEGAESAHATAFALLKKLLEKIPLVGLGVEAFNTARDARLAYEKEGQLADLITSLWTIVKAHDDALQALSEDRRGAKITTELVAGAPADGAVVPLVLDEYLGMTALLHLPLRPVQSEQIDASLVQAYAQSGLEQAQDVVDQANRIRQSMGDVAANAPKRIEASRLTKNGKAESFWRSAFEVARNEDSRMVASLLFAKDEDAFSDRAKHKRKKLLDYLTSGGDGPRP